MPCKLCIYQDREPTLNTLYISHRKEETKYPNLFLTLGLLSITENTLIK